MTKLYEVQDLDVEVINFAPIRLFHIINEDTHRPVRTHATAAEVAAYFDQHGMERFLVAPAGLASFLFPGDRHG